MCHVFQIEHRGADDPLTALCPNLTNVDPDDAFSVVPYEKGQTFLYYLETLVGGPGRELKKISIISAIFCNAFCNSFLNKLFLNTKNQYH